MDLVKPNERVDDLLVNGLKIIQNPSSSDSVATRSNLLTLLPAE
ncbi:MAG: hypothetical protein ACLUSP_10325 [Christensenellales bacterium]